MCKTKKISTDRLEGLLLHTMLKEESISNEETKERRDRGLQGDIFIPLMRQKIQQALSDEAARKRIKKLIKETKKKIKRLNKTKTEPKLVKEIKRKLKRLNKVQKNLKKAHHC